MQVVHTCRGQQRYRRPKSSARYNKKHGYCYRCIWCNNFYKTNAALKGHHSRKVSDPGGCKNKPKSKTSTLTKKAVMRLRRKGAQKQFDHVNFV